MYPLINSWITFKKDKDGNYIVGDYFSEEEYLVGPEAARFLRQLDGKRDPYKIKTAFTKSEVDEILKTAYSLEIIRSSKTVLKTPGSLYRTVYTFKRKKRRRTCCKVINALLMLLWLPVFFFGTRLFIDGLDIIDSFDYLTLGCVLSVIAGAFLHEAGHAIATICYGGNVFEAGIKIGIIPGAYVLSDDENVKSTAKRVQILAAGVEMNFLLSGVLLAFSVLFPQLGGFFLSGGTTNIIIGFLNLLFIGGLDGQKIVCELFGDPELFENAKKALFESAERRRILKEGGHGYVKLLLGASLMSFKLLLPLLIAINIAGVLS